MTFLIPHSKSFTGRVGGRAGEDRSRGTSEGLWEGRGALAAHLLVNSCRDKKRADVGLAPFHLLTPLHTESVPERAPAHPQSVSFRFINTD